MRPDMIGMLTVFTVLIVLTVERRLTHAVSAPSNVSVKCDSYGVVVEWMTDDPRQQAESLLELKPNVGKSVFESTNNSQYNISDWLTDPAYNHYFVKVKARDGEHESAVTESQIFSYNFLSQANIICDLEFPAVNLFPRNGKLFISFTNPLRLYRGTPALRNLSKTEILRYTVISSKISEECLECPLECPLECFLECPFKSNTCETNVSFPEEQEEYCVTLYGRISQTRIVSGKKPYCYKGTLNPRLPVTVRLIVLLGSSAAVLAVVLATVFLLKSVSKFIKKKSLSKFPPFLENKLTSTPLITPLKMELEPVAKNPRVEPAVKIPLNSTCCLQETTTQPETSATTKGKDMCTGSESSELEASFSQDSCDEYGNGAELSGSDWGNGAELSSSGLSTGYDRPHTLIEMSPGDLVKNYGTC